jgi:type I restriction enzyme M protein
MVLDKAEAATRQGIFMVDASKGFMKDGNKNRLREQDIHKIVDAFTRQLEIPKYSRLVPLDEIADPKNDYNLNLPRYIDSTQAEDIQRHQRPLARRHSRPRISMRFRITGESCPACGPWRLSRFAQATPRSHPASELKSAILGHAEFTAFNQQVVEIFTAWSQRTRPELDSFTKSGHPKSLIATISEDLLTAFRYAPLLERYDVTSTSWISGPSPCRTIATSLPPMPDRHARPPHREGQKRPRRGKGWACDLVPKLLLVAAVAKEQSALDAQQAELEAASAAIAELEEEHGGEEVSSARSTKSPRPKSTPA